MKEYSSLDLIKIRYNIKIPSIVEKENVIECILYDPTTSKLVKIYNAHADEIKKF
jgi:hypothetical protein